MKTDKKRMALGGALLLCAVMIFVAPALTSAQTGSQYCEIALTRCPEMYDGDTLRVPLDVVALSAQIRACGITGTTETPGGAPPSVVFVIDQSSSMYGAGYDPQANRYKVTSALLDTLFAKAPETEVGVVIFRDDLLFDLRNDNETRRNLFDPNLVRYTAVGLSGQTRSGNAAGGYMPFLRLNDSSPTIQRGGYFSRDSSHSGGSALTGYDVLKNIMKTAPLRVESNVNPNRDIEDIEYRPAFGSSGTNVSRAFDAAREILETARAPRANQYIIFISDGESNRPQSNVSQRDHYMLGLDVPTTFTVFLSPDGRVHQNLQTMSNAIRANNRDSSQYWGLTSDYNAILELMMENIITPMLAQASGTPNRVTITSAGVADSSGTITGGGFTFSRMLPIDTAEITPVTMGIRYRVEVDTTFRLPSGNDTTYTVRVVPDSLITYTFHINRTEGAESDWATSQGLESHCGVKPTLSLRHNNTPVDTVKGSMTTLTVTLDNTDGLFNYGQSVQVLVFNKGGVGEGDTPEGFLDTVTLTLTRGTGANANIYTANFPRTVSPSANRDGTLQHLSLDSIVALFRNPQIPLDTNRVEALYLSHTMAFYKDTPPTVATVGDSIPGGTTSTRAGEPIDIYAGLINSDNSLDMWGPGFDPNDLVWTVSGGGDATLNLLSGSGGTTFLATIAQTYTVTATYTSGSMVVTRSLQVVVNPGPPAYLQVVFDESRITARVDTNELKRNKAYEFDRNTSNTTFYVVERDAYGNLIQRPDDAVWDSNDQNVIRTGGTGSSTPVNRLGNNFTANLFVVVQRTIPEGECDTRVTPACVISDTVAITVVGETAVGIGPNPFVPGVSRPIDMFINHPTARETYQKILEGPSANSNGGAAGENKTGILIAATAPRAVEPQAGGGGGTGGFRYANATVIIYDAVGNVVWRSRPNNILLADDNVTFGFVWDGRNAKGRIVAPGTYLVRMVGRLSNGERFSNDRKIGVRKDGSVN